MIHAIMRQACNQDAAAERARAAGRRSVLRGGPPSTRASVVLPAACGSLVFVFDRAGDGWPGDGQS